MILESQRWKEVTQARMGGWCGQEESAQDVYGWSGNSVNLSFLGWGNSPGLLCLAILYAGHWGIVKVWKQPSTGHDVPWETCREEIFMERDTFFFLFVFLQMIQLTAPQFTQLQSIRTVKISNRPLSSFCQVAYGTGIFRGKRGQWQDEGRDRDEGFWNKGGEDRWRTR